MTEKERFLLDAIKLGVNGMADARDSLWSVVGIVSPGVKSTFDRKVSVLAARLEALIEQEVQTRLRSIK